MLIHYFEVILLVCFSCTRQHFFGGGLLSQYSTNISVILHLVALTFDVTIIKEKHIQISCFRWSFLFNIRWSFLALILHFYMLINPEAKTQQFKLKFKIWFILKKCICFLTKKASSGSSSAVSMPSSSFLLFSGVWAVQPFAKKYKSIINKIKSESKRHSKITIRHILQSSFKTKHVKIVAGLYMLACYYSRLWDWSCMEIKTNIT